MFSNLHEADKQLSAWPQPRRPFLAYHYTEARFPNIWNVMRKHIRDPSMQIVYYAST